MKWTNKLVIVLLVLLISSCTVTKTYNIGIESSPNPKPPNIVDIENNINSLFVILGQEKNGKLNSYIWNGEYLTIKTKRKNSKALDNLIPITICPLNQPDRCFLVKTIKGKRVLVPVDRREDKK